MPLEKQTYCVDVSTFVCHRLKIRGDAVSSEVDVCLLLAVGPVGLT